jgi:hypothetical protein
MPVQVDYSRARSPAGECQAQEQLRRNQIRFGDNMNSIVSPAESTARYR